MNKLMQTMGKGAVSLGFLATALTGCATYTAPVQRRIYSVGEGYAAESESGVRDVYTITDSIAIRSGFFPNVKQVKTKNGFAYEGHIDRTSEAYLDLKRKVLKMLDKDGNKDIEDSEASSGLMSYARSFVNQ